MADGYAEHLRPDRRVPGDSAWFLTANDDAGGGDLRGDRGAARPDRRHRARPDLQSVVPRLAAGAHREALRSGRRGADRGGVRARPSWTGSRPSCSACRSRACAAAPRAVLRAARLLPAAPALSFEHKSKDTLKLAGIRLGQVCNEDCPLDKRRHVCSQVETGVSVRAYMTLLAYAKALAWFRGNAAVEVEDLRQLAPFVLHEKLTPNRQSPFFAKGHEALLGDKVAWIRAMFDLGARAVRGAAAGRPLPRRAAARAGPPGPRGAVGQGGRRPPQDARGRVSRLPAGRRAVRAGLRRPDDPQEPLPALPVVPRLARPERGVAPGDRPRPNDSPTRQPRALAPGARPLGLRRRPRPRAAARGRRRGVHRPADAPHAGQPPPAAAPRPARPAGGAVRARGGAPLPLAADAGRQRQAAAPAGRAADRAGDRATRRPADRQALPGPTLRLPAEPAARRADQRRAAGGPRRRLRRPVPRAGRRVRRGAQSRVRLHDGAVRGAVAAAAGNAGRALRRETPGGGLAGVPRGGGGARRRIARPHPQRLHLPRPVSRGDLAPPRDRRGREAAAREGWLEAAFGDQANELDPDALVEVVQPLARRARRGSTPRAAPPPGAGGAPGAGARRRRRPARRRQRRAGPDDPRRLPACLGDAPGRVAEAILWYYEREAERLRLRLEQVPACDPLLPTTPRAVGSRRRGVRDRLDRVASAGPAWRSPA
ncbi:MAG: hypothetical protein MZV63_06155 [Marinilabiliales bacterium]|nr:hypothetical protein [Marinilabiliales bacterium]